MTIEEIEKLVCKWSMELKVPLTEIALNVLVGRLALAIAPELKKEDIWV